MHEFFRKKKSQDHDPAFNSRMLGGSRSFEKLGSSYFCANEAGSSEFFVSIKVLLVVLCLWKNLIVLFSKYNHIIRIKNYY